MLARVIKHLYFILDWILVEKSNGTNVERLACWGHNEASKMKSPKDKSVMSFTFYLLGTGLCHILVSCCGQKRSQGEGKNFYEKDQKEKKNRGVVGRKLNYTWGADITAPKLSLLERV